MCGILCQINFSESKPLQDKNLLQRIKNRGPDSCHSVEVQVCEGTVLTLCSAVLWMRGSELVPQPVENKNGILLYNGDIFDETWDVNTNDTKLIMEKVSNKTRNSSEQDLIVELKLLKGPFSIIYYDKSTMDLYFTRDRIGRTTLLCYGTPESFIIGSVLGRKYKCVEIPATGIHILNLLTKKIRICPWDNEDNGDSKIYAMDDWLEILEKQQSLPDELHTFKFLQSENLNKEDDVFKYIQTTALETKCKLSLMRKLMDHVYIKATVNKIIELLEKSIKLRLKAQPQKCKNCVNKITDCNHCTMGILFSGGLDCTILALMSDKYLRKEQPIELLNVAFKNVNGSSYDVPDRLTGRQSFEALKNLCPSRKWVFREINVPKVELEKHQRTNIADLVHPRCTILDESLGSALWFAARGQDEHSTSPCRVLLLGSGADELFGGYTRHRNALKRHGWSGLDKELQLDWRRISFRNLARDNRVICDHGRQPRMPYLDEDFTEYVLKLKPWLKCFPSENLGQGVGDKLILRLVAFNIGLTNVATFPKRALQFGSRIANKKEKGSDISKTFLDIGINE